MTSQPLTRVTLRQEVARLLRSDITAGLLEPATLYPIAEVAVRLGVSITPVREALLELSRDGLVEVVRNRGFRVREITEQDLDDIVEIRRLLEVPAVRRLAGTVPAVDLAELRELAAATVEAARSGDLSRYLALDKDFHLSLLERAGNARLTAIVSRLRDETRLYGLGRLAGTDTLVATTHEHGRLLDALQDGDGELAGQILTEHLDHVRGVWAGRP